MRDVSVCWVFVLVGIGGRVPIFFGDAGVLIVWFIVGIPCCDFTRITSGWDLFLIFFIRFATKAGAHTPMGQTPVAK